MPKVKIFILSENYNSDYEDAVYRLGKEVSDWEEISEEDYSNLIKYRGPLESHLKESGAISYWETICIVAQNVISAPKAISSIKDLIAKAEEKEKQNKEKAEKARKAQSAAKEKKQKQKELKQLQQLKEKYEKTTQ